MIRPVDLDWLDRLVDSLATPSTTKRSLAAFFGVSSADVPSDGWSAVARFGVARVRIYDLPHVEIDLAVQVVFHVDARPRLVDLTARLGESQAVPSLPDDFSGTSRQAFYPQRGNADLSLRVFATSPAEDRSSVSELQVDRSLPNRDPD